MGRLIRNLTFLILTSITLGSCTITGTFYLINSGSQNVEVTIKLNRLYEGIEEYYIVRTDKLEDYTVNKIKYFTYEQMYDDKISIDKNEKQFQFRLNSGDFAFIGQGSNARLRIVDKIEIKTENETISFDPKVEGEFDIKNSGLMKFVGIRVIE